MDIVPAVLEKCVDHLFLKLSMIAFKLADPCFESFKNDETSISERDKDDLMWLLQGGVSPVKKTCEDEP